MMNRWLAAARKTRIDRQARPGSSGSRCLGNNPGHNLLETVFALGVTDRRGSTNLWENLVLQAPLKHIASWNKGEPFIIMRIKLKIENPFTGRNSNMLSTLVNLNHYTSTSVIVTLLCHDWPFIIICIQSNDWITNTKSPNCMFVRCVLCWNIYNYIYQKYLETFKFIYLSKNMNYSLVLQWGHCHSYRVHLSWVTTQLDINTTPRAVCHLNNCQASALTSQYKKLKTL